MKEQNIRTEGELVRAAIGRMGDGLATLNSHVSASRGDLGNAALCRPNNSPASLYSLAHAPSQTIRLQGMDLPVSLLIDALTQAGVLSRKQLITTDELAELIRMKPQTIAKWRSAGIADPPPAIHLGRQVRYGAEEVMAWIYRNRL
jgi:predicted DNA-binding transcriptional regulator AlpA